MKKRIVMFFAVAIAVVCVQASVWTDPATGLKWYYTIDWDNIFVEYSSEPQKVDALKVEGVSPSNGSVEIPRVLFYNPGPRGPGYVPDKPGGYYVTVRSVADNAFINHSNLTSVTIPQTVWSIGKKAFNNCSGLTSVTIPDSVTSIGAESFQNCSRLWNTTRILGVKLVDGWVVGATGELSGSLEIDGVRGIADEAFRNCTNLTSVTIHPGVKIIGDYAFRGCSGLTSVTIHSGVKTIGDGAFSGCSGLTSVTIHSGVKTIGDGAFSGCSGLTSVTMPDSVTTIGYGAFRGCSGLTSVTMPDSVTTIGDDAFSGCSGLKGVTIPNSVTIIGEGAFSGCSGIEEITLPFIGKCRGTTGKTSLFGYIFGTASYTGGVLAHQFYGSTTEDYDSYIPVKLKKVVITDDTLLGYGAFSGCSGLTDVTISNGVTSIGYGAFSGCSKLANVTIPNSVTSIGPSAFSGCIGLTSMMIPDSVTIIGYSAFSGCSGLTNVHITDLAKWCGISFGSSSANPFSYAKNLFLNGTLVGGNLTIPDSVTNIGSYVFSGSSWLTSVTIPDSVTSIKDGAFYNCSGLTSVYITDLARWCGISFGSSYANPLCYAKNLLLNGTLVGGDLTIPDSATNIGTYAFPHCDWLTSVMMPDSVKSIGDGAFCNCANLVSVMIPDSVTSIGASAFSGCSGLTGVTIPDSVKSIGDSAFSGCSGIMDVVVSQCVCDNELRSVFSSAYQSITNVVVSDGVTSIGSHVFSGCGGLTSVTIPSSVTSIGSYAFSGCSALTSVTIPDSVKSIGNEAFYNCSGLTEVHITDLAKWCAISFGDLDDNPLYYAKNLVLNGSVVGGDLTIPDGVASIGNYAFYNCNGLINVTIPGSVMNIGVGAFSACGGVTTFIVDAENVNYKSVDGLLLSKDGTALISGVNKSEVVIPDSVTSIKPYAFSGCNKIVSVTIPKSVTSIGSSAFSGCSELEEISLPFIGACRGGTGGTSTLGYIFGTLPYTGGIKTHQTYAANPNTSPYPTNPYSVDYYIPSALRKVVITDETVLGYGAFCGCSGLINVLIGNSVTSIGPYAFSGCGGLTSMTIPDSVTSIGDGAFSGCYELTDVNITDLEKWCVISFGSSSANPLFYGHNLFLNGSLVEELTIPNSVISIKSYAFSGCSGLKSVTIQDGVKRIESYAFAGCRGLKNVYIPQSVTSIGDSVFSACSGLESMTLPFVGNWRGDSGTMYALFGAIFGTSSYSGGTATQQYFSSPYRSAYTYYIPSSLKEVVITDETQLGYGAFRGCSGLTSVTIPDGVTSIGEEAFRGCSGLTSVTIPDGVTSIGEEAFYDCSGLTSVTIPNSVTSIGKWAFSFCSGLASVTIPGGVTSIGNNAFLGCRGLTSVTLTGDCPTIGSSVFSDENPSCAAYLPRGNSTFSVVDGKWYGMTVVYCDPVPTGPYTVTFYANGGVGGTSVTLDCGAALAAPTVTREDYTFVGWMPSVPTTVPAANVTYTAQWQLNRYAVTFDANGGMVAGYGSLTTNAWSLLSRDSDGMEEYQSASIGKSASTSMLLTIDGPYDLTFSWKVSSESGYDYLRWYLDGTEKAKISGTGGTWQDVSVSVPAGEHTIKWTYSKDSGTVKGNDCGWVRVPKIKTSSMSLDHGQTVGELPTPTRTGYVFKGWFTAASGGAQISSSTVVTGDVTYYAHWAMVCVVTFDANCGSLDASSQTKTVEEETEIGTLPTSTRTGHTFDGWWTSASGGAQIPASTIVTGNMTCYAHWAVNQYTMTFDANGGVGGTSMTLDYGTTLSAPAVTREGYTFMGWEPALSETAPASNATYTSQWRINQYTVTFDANGGTGGTSTTLDYGTTIVAPTVTRNRAMFAGWWTAKSGGTQVAIPEVVAGDVTYYAHWTSESEFEPLWKIDSNGVLTGIDDLNGCKDIVIPSDVKRIGSSAFKGCNGITSVTIPDSVTSIGYDAFYGCIELASVTIGNGVGYIGYDAFHGCAGLTNVTFGSGVWGIGEGAFYDCSGLTIVKIPNSVTSIGASAFYHCSGLTNVTIGNRVASIESCAFSGCVGLTSVVIPDSVKSIGMEAFLGCSGLTSVTIGNGVTSIGSWAFEGCCNLASLTIPDSVTDIGDWVFKDCSGLRSVTVPQIVLLSSFASVFPSAYESITNVVVCDGVMNIGPYAFWGCNGLASVTIPDSVISIDVCAFYQLSGLTSVTIPYSVTSIGNSAFSGCDGLSIVYVSIGTVDRVKGMMKSSGFDISGVSFVEPDAAIVVFDANGGSVVETIRNVVEGATVGELPLPARTGYTFDGWFTSASGGTQIASSTIVSGDATYYAHWTPVSEVEPVWKINSDGVLTGIGDTHGRTDIVVPSSVVRIGPYAFSGCSGLTSVTIPDSVTSIGDLAFSGCRGLTSVTIPDGVTSIGDGAFSGCSGLTSVTIPDSVTNIGWSAFEGCRSLTSVTISQRFCSLSYGLRSAFQERYTSITNVVICDGVTSIENSVFSGFIGLKGVTIPNSVTNIGEGVFSGCSGLTSVTIPNRVTSIGDGAFFGCTGLDNVAIPESVTSLGDGAFRDCSGLTSMTIPNSVTNIGVGVFWGCSGLTSVTIPDSVTSIGSDAFRDCSGLTSVTIPDSVTSIGSSAFYGCSGLASVTIPNGVTSIGSSAFYGCSRLKNVNIPNSATNIVNTAFSDCAFVDSVTVPQSVLAARLYNVFRSSYKSITSVVICNGATSVPRSAFSRCTSLASLTIPASVTSIASSAFNDCSALTTVYVSPGDSNRVKSLMASSGFDVTRVSFIESGMVRVVFDANGGIGNEASRSVIAGGAVGELPMPTRTGYTFAGWWTAASGGAQITAVTKVTANVTYYAHWTENGGGGGSGGGDTPSPTTFTVTFNANGGAVGTTRSVTSGAAVGPLPTTTRTGYTFAGWWTAASGGAQITTATKVTANVTYYAHWTKNSTPAPTPDPDPTPVPDEDYGLYYGEIDGAAPDGAASEYNGYLVDDDGNMKGTIQAKVGKPNKKTGLATIKATVQLGAKKVTLKAVGKGSVQIAADGPTELELVGGEECVIVLGADGFAGSYGAYAIDGSRNFFTSKDKAELAAANAVLGKWLGGISILADAGNFTVTISAKGKAKVSGTLANGKKATGNAVFLIGEEWACVPVVLPKANISFALWLPLDGGEVVVSGLGDDVISGRGGALKSGAEFRIDADEFAAVTGIDALPYLPDGVSVEQSGSKWVVAGGAKAGKVVYQRGTQEIDESKLGENPSGLKLTYKKADGSFKGSFKAYADVKGKLKATTVSVSGIVLNGVGYGTATVKGKGSVPVTIE